MKVIICGGGQVGFNIARHLAAESNDVTVIDQSAELIRRVSDSLDVRAMVGHASHPDVLEGAGARDGVHDLMRPFMISHRSSDSARLVSPLAT